MVKVRSRRPWTEKSSVERTIITDTGVNDCSFAERYSHAYSADADHHDVQALSYADTLQWYDTLVDIW